MTFCGHICTKLNFCFFVPVEEAAEAAKRKAEEIARAAKKKAEEAARFIREQAEKAKVGMP